MKSLLLIPLLLLSTNHFAQERIDVKSEIVSDQANHWMMNIATNPQMRLEMMQMMIDHTMDKPDEMLQLVNQIMNNSEMDKMIREAAFHNANKGNKFINMPEMIKRDKNTMKRTEAPEKPIIKD
ncbi:hypothetical protein ASZ90_004486 [hydrocarbon metagenome]|uniref:Uncharacterized protein n=1 Tax=hydrocarbon metagenome TaxID=938273 RepID=A0A0W8FXQ1_9ZZZZ